MLFESRRVVFTILVLGGVTGFGALGYRILADASWGDAIFMTLITLSTVGYGEVFPLDAAGRVFTSILITLGIVLVFGLSGMWVRVIFEGELSDALGRRRRGRALRDLKDHYIICGYGRFGSRVAAELLSRGERVVVIDETADAPPDLIFIDEDATKDSVLVEAKVDTARALLAALPSDADNVYVTLMAKELNPELFIVSRCESEGGERRLRTAGAARVVAPFAVSAHRMAELATNPAIIDVDDLATAAGKSHVKVAEVEVREGSALVGARLDAGELLRTHSVVPVGRLDDEGRLTPVSADESKLQPGDVVVVFGTPLAVAAFASTALTTVPEID